MTSILFIKTSSLGDVVHHLPVIADLRRQLPAAHVGWVVEEAFAPLVQLHPGVDEVIPVAWRRWRHALANPAAWREIGTAIRHLRERHYDAVVDTQGLVRTAAMALLARGHRHGYDRASVREPLAALAYEKRYAVSRDLHAIARNRALAGAALGYRPSDAIDYGLDSTRLAANTGGHEETVMNAPYAVLLHATARVEKQWPEEHWTALGQMLAARGFEVVLPWGSPAERERSERIAAAVPDARVPEKRPLDAVARLIAGAAVVVGVDTGLVHVAAALGVPLVAIFRASAPELTRPLGQGPTAILGRKGGQVSLGEVEAVVEQVIPAG
ncbi:MAG: lipopolysaccharide heptosyltransferase I [Xanthobacteraceae bacterium]